MRILITGSRNWVDPPGYRIEWDLGDYLAIMRTVNFVDTAKETLTIIHGDCPTGADALAKKFCNDNAEVIEEAYPADWKKHGRAAGPIRNELMVQSGADVCLAFPLSSSKGTKDCIARARKANIPVFIYGETPDVKNL